MTNVQKGLVALWALLLGAAAQAQEEEQPQDLASLIAQSLSDLTKDSAAPIEASAAGGIVEARYPLMTTGHGKIYKVRFIADAINYERLYDVPPRNGYVLINLVPLSMSKNFIESAFGDDPLRRNQRMVTLQVEEALADNLKSAIETFAQAAGVIDSNNLQSLDGVLPGIEAYAEETAAFQNRCESEHKFKSHYDCACLAQKYGEKRAELGPHANQSYIIGLISKTCADASAGQDRNYRQCLSTTVRAPANVSIESYCRCYADTYAQLYNEQSPGAGSRLDRQLQNRAMVTCRRPDLAERYYRD